MGKASSGNVLPPTTPVTVSLTLTLAEANNLLVALANAINNLGPKNKGKKGGAKPPTKGGAKGTPKGATKATTKATPKVAPKGTPKGR